MLTNDTPPAVLLARITETGIIDPEAGAWIVEALARWQDGIDWPRASGLPSPDRARKAIRDYWLMQAAEHLAGTPWQIARQLHTEATRFESRQWPAWKRGSFPPPEASDLQACLFLAMRSGATLPTTRQAFLAVLNKVL